MRLSRNKRSTIEGARKKTSSDDDRTPVPVVSQQGDVLVLHFGSNYIQSQMIVGQPDFLALAYTRTMMAFEIYLPTPRSIALLGLGGGSIVKWCYRHHPKTKLTVIENNPRVIALRDAFQIPPVDERLQILCEDGARFVATTTTRFEVLLVDCFTAAYPPQELCSMAFFAACHKALTEAGLMVVNLCVKNHLRILSRIRKSFDGQVLLSADDNGNTVVFACKGKTLWAKNEDAHSFRRKLRRFERKYGLGRAMAPRG